MYGSYQAVNYVEHLLSQCGTGSLSLYLKKKHWATKTLRTAYERPGKGFAVFAFEVHLTEHGLECVEDVVASFFQYVEMLKSVGPQKWIWDELRVMNDAEFHFGRKKEEAIQTVQNIAVGLQNFPAQDVLLARYSVISDYKPELITEILSLIRPTNMRMIVTGKVNAKIADTEDEWHGARYRYSKIQPNLLQKWRNCGLNHDFSLPKPNPFIPGGFGLKPRDKCADSANTPRLIAESELSHVWFLQDSHFNLPQAVMILAVLTPLPMQSPNDYNMAELFARILLDNIASKYGSDASEAGLSHTVEVSSLGLSVLVEGYDCKCGDLFCRIVSALRSTMAISAEEFKDIKEDYARDLGNEQDEEPYVFALAAVSKILRKESWSTEKLYETLKRDDQSVEDLRAFTNKLWANVKLEWLFAGNLTEQEALGLYTESSRCFENSCPLTFTALNSIRQGTREGILPPGTVHIYRMKNRSYSDSAALLLLQCGVSCSRELVLIELLQRMLTESFYDTLRTQEQLGYVVLTHLRKGKGAASLLMLVQGEKTPQFLDDRMENFLQNFTVFIDELDEKTFDEHRSSYVAEKREPSKTLGAFAVQVFQEIVQEEYSFEGRTQELEEIECLNVDDLKGFYHEWIAPDATKRKKLSIQVAASGNDDSGSKQAETPRASNSENDQMGQTEDYQEYIASIASKIRGANKGLKLNTTAMSNISLPPKLVQRTKLHLKREDNNREQSGMDRLGFQPNENPTNVTPVNGAAVMVDVGNSQDGQMSKSLVSQKSHRVKLNVLGTSFGSDRISQIGSRRPSRIVSEIISLALPLAAHRILGDQFPPRIGRPSTESSPGHQFPRQTEFVSGTSGESQTDALPRLD